MARSRAQRPRTQRLKKNARSFFAKPLCVKIIVCLDFTGDRGTFAAFCPRGQASVADRCALRQLLRRLWTGGRMWPQKDLLKVEPSVRLWNLSVTRLASSLSPAFVTRPLRARLTKWLGGLLLAFSPSSPLAFPLLEAMCTRPTWRSSSVAHSVNMARPARRCSPIGLSNAS